MMNRSKYCGKLFWFCCLLLPATVQSQLLPETATDYLGWYKSPGHDKSYQTLIQAGAKVINFTADTSFACIWIPSNYASLAVKRVMVCMHGTKGTAYDEMKDELSNAQANGYALVAVQWWVQGVTPQADGTYFEEEKSYRLIDTTLKHLQAKYGAEANKTGYVGFSRGSAASYLIMFYDRYRKTNHFALSISHSGGIPPPPGAPKPILADVLAGKYGKNPFAGTSFFLYCGMKDEEWGTTMCDQISYADSLIRLNNGQVVRHIRDADGKHGGYRQNPGYQASAIQWFLNLTTPPTAPALSSPANAAINQPLEVILQWSTTANAALFDVQLSTRSDFSTTVIRDSLLSANVSSKRTSALLPGTTYYWRVRCKNNVGTSAWSETRSFTTSGVTDVHTLLSKSLMLSVSPNPVSEQTTIKVRLNKQEALRLVLCDLLGREIVVLSDSTLDVGEHEWQLDAHRRVLADGTYSMRLQTPTIFITKLLQVLR